MAEADPLRRAGRYVRRPTDHRACISSPQPLGLRRQGLRQRLARPLWERRPRRDQRPQAAPYPNQPRKPCPTALHHRQSQGPPRKTKITSEQAVRQTIDELLSAAGWAVQDASRADIHAERGVAIREFPLPGHGFADYLLCINAAAAGIIEAKKEGTTLSGVAETLERVSSGAG